MLRPSRGEHGTMDAQAPRKGRAPADRFAGSGEPANVFWFPLQGFSTMSDFIGPSTPSSSPFSFSPTLNLSSAPDRSSTSALKSAVETPIPLWASFIERPVYLHGPPDASQI